MRSAQEFNDVQRLIADGMNDCAIARITGIPRRTVRDWRCNHQSGHGIGANPLHAALSTICPLSPPKRTATYLAYTWATAAYRDIRDRSN